MFRQQSVPIEPLTLFQKMGVGQLDLYILSPCKNSQEFQTFMQKWPNTGSSTSKTQTLPLTALTSVSALLVWHPACPQDKVVRVLFAGITPQANIIQGLEKLKGLTFLQKPTVTAGDLERLGEDRKAKRTDSQDSGRSQVQDPIPKLAKDRRDKNKGKELLIKENRKASNELSSKDPERTRIKEMAVKQKSAASENKTTKKGGVKDGKKEENNLGTSVPSKPKNEMKTKNKKEAKNDSKTGAKKPKKLSGKEENNRKKSHSNTEMTNSASKEKQIPVSSRTEKPRQNSGAQHQENPCASKVSTPEDMTADFLKLREETLSAEQAELVGENDTDDSARPTKQNANVNAAISSADQPISCKKQAKVVGFPLPLSGDRRDESSVQHDTTPTEFTLLDGALKYSPSSRPSPENHIPGSPEEETVEPDSTGSRPNSAGHTPYCLSPDDVWCKRATLSRIQAQMVDSESDANPSHEPCRQSEGGQSSQVKSREKHLSFLSLGSLKDAPSDPSPSVATTTTTHSMPAEVSSPQSTEVDESLSMSLEQGPTPVSQRDGDDASHQSGSNGVHFVGMSLPVRRSSRALGQSSETARTLAPSMLHFEASSHDVDLCLVSPCEFKHFKPADASEPSKAPFAPHHHAINNNNPKDMSPSESNVPVCMEDCPSTTADGLLDSDDEESCSEPSNSPHNLHASQALPQDPPPAPYRDNPPLPPHPDVSMPVPQPDSEDHGQRVKTRGVQGRKSALVSREKKIYHCVFVVYLVKKKK